MFHMTARIMYTASAVQLVPTMMVAPLLFVSEKEQPQLKAIENFLGRNIYKIPVPEELGEAPEYNPRSGASRSNHKGGGSRKHKIIWEKNGTVLPMPQ